MAEGQVYADDGFPISIVMEAPLLKKLTSSWCLVYKTRRRIKDANKRSFSFTKHSFRLYDMNYL